MNTYNLNPLFGDIINKQCATLKIYSLIFVTYDYYRFEQFIMSTTDKNKLLKYIEFNANKFYYECDKVYYNPDDEIKKDLQEKEIFHWEIITNED